MPCFNNGPCLVLALTSIPRQQIPVEEWYHVQAALFHGSGAVAEQPDVCVIVKERITGL